MTIYSMRITMICDRISHQLSRSV